MREETTSILTRALYCTLWVCFRTPYDYSSACNILGECRALWGSPDVLHVNIVVKAGQYMTKLMISIVGSECVTEGGSWGWGLSITLRCRLLASYPGHFACGPGNEASRLPVRGR